MVKKDNNISVVLIILLFLVIVSVVVYKRLPVVDDRENKQSQAYLISNNVQNRLDNDYFTKEEVLALLKNRDKNNEFELQNINDKIDNIKVVTYKPTATCLFSEEENSSFFVMSCRHDLFK